MDFVAEHVALIVCVLFLNWVNRRGFVMRTAAFSQDSPKNFFPHAQQGDLKKKSNYPSPQILFSIRSAGFCHCQKLWG